MPEKTISGWLIIDWQQGSHRTRKSKPGAAELGTNELVAELTVDVNVPEVEVPELAVEIDVPEPHVHAATLEALDDEQLPGWTDIANDVIEPPIPGDYVEFQSEVDSVSMQVLTKASTRPDPEAVRDYVGETMREVAGGVADE